LTRVGRSNKQMGEDVTQPNRPQWLVYHTD